MVHNGLWWLLLPLPNPCCTAALRWVQLLCTPPVLRHHASERPGDVAVSGGEYAGYISTLIRSGVDRENADWTCLDANQWWMIQRVNIQRYSEMLMVHEDNDNQVTRPIWTSAGGAFDGQTSLWRRRLHHPFPIETFTCLSRLHSEKRSMKPWYVVWMHEMAMIIDRHWLSLAIINHHYYHLVRTPLLVAPQLH